MGVAAFRVIDRLPEVIAMRRTTPHQQEAGKRLEAGETQRSVTRSYNVSPWRTSTSSGAPVLATFVIPRIASGCELD